MTHTSTAPATPQFGGLTLSQLWALLTPWRGWLALVGVSVLLGAVVELAPPLLVQKIVDGPLAHGRSEGLLAIAALYLGATAAVQVLGFLTEYLTAIIAQGVLRRLRVQLFSHLLTLPITAAMLALSPLLSLVAALPVVPVVLVTRSFQVGVRNAERASRQAVGLQNTHLQETLSGVEVIRALGGEATFIARFRAALRDGVAAYNGATVYSALYIPLMVIVSAVAMALVLWVGVAGQGLLASLHSSLGTLTAFVLLLQRLFVPIMTLGNEWQTVQAALAGLERIVQVLALPADEPAPRRSHQSPSRSSATVELRQVRFGYLPNRPVLRGVSLAVQPGEHVVLVGRTGAGKNSVLHLLGGLYAPWRGTVRVAGADPTSLTDGQRRRAMGVVQQMVHLFRGTVVDNLTLGDGSVSREAVQRAAAIAGADAFIQALPQGYDTWLGEGLQLSAGQRQLLALARALVWDPAVLLLDEATAAIDSASEAAVRAAIREAVIGSGRAVLTVAHRLATAQDADCVLVMEAGQIVESGPPDELKRQGGRFAALLELEAAGWNWHTDGQSLGGEGETS